MDWPRLIPDGIALAAEDGRLRHHLTGFLLARGVGRAGRYRDGSGQWRQAGSALRRLGLRHYQVASAALTAGRETVLVPSAATRFQRPPIGRAVYLTGCPVEVPGPLLNRLLRNPEGFLSGTVPLARSSPDPGFATDPALVAFLFDRGGEPCLGFARRAFLARIGIDYRPMNELALAPEEPPGRPDPLPAPRDRTFARIKSYRGERAFIGVHEYYVRCPACGAPGDFPGNLFVERFIRYRCAACAHVFHSEALRSNLSLRIHGR